MEPALQSENPLLNQSMVFVPNPRAIWFAPAKKHLVLLLNGSRLLGTAPSFEWTTQSPFGHGMWDDTVQT